MANKQPLKESEEDMIECILQQLKDNGTPAIAMENINKGDKCKLDLNTGYLTKVHNG